VADVDVPTGKRVAAKVLFRMRMCPADLEQYGGPDDGWFTFDPDYVDELPARDLIALERAAAAAGEPINLLPTVYLVTDEEAMSSVSVKAKLLLARRQAGYADAWADFQPKLGQLRYRVEPVFDTPAGADPLADGSTASSTAPAEEPSPAG
jgi:hypothetical protein